MNGVRALPQSRVSASAPTFSISRLEQKTITEVAKFGAGRGRLHIIPQNYKLAGELLRYQKSRSLRLFLHYSE